MRYLHTMLRVRNLDAALDFYANKLGLKEVRRVDNEQGRFTLVFLVAAQDEELVAKSAPSGFAAPLAYFIFIILSTLRLDFWLSTFTGFVAAAELFAKALPLPVTGQADENLLAVGCRERLVDRPGTFARRHWRQRCCL